nr:sigma 54-interacting transcriptional regulator [Effusibacillus lacus]
MLLQLSLDISKLVSESFFVVENGKILFFNDARKVPAEKYRYVFVKRIGPENDSSPKSTQILIKDIIGSNERFLKTIQLARFASNVDANVLLLGESGTGKELFARAIHNESPRKHNPFIG